MKNQPKMWYASNGDCDIAVAKDIAIRGRARLGPFSDELSSAPSNDPAKSWNHMVDCEARNALQVILSGSEILLDRGCCISASDQRVILERILASAHHLHCMIATLTKPDEQLGEIVLDAVNTDGLRER
jgi:hypothetical protein